MKTGQLLYYDTRQFICSQHVGQFLSLTANRCSEDNQINILKGNNHETKTTRLTAAADAD